MKPHQRRMRTKGLKQSTTGELWNILLTGVIRRLHEAFKDGDEEDCASAIDLMLEIGQEIRSRGTEGDTEPYSPLSKEEVESTLEMYGHHRTLAAKHLNVSRAAICWWIRKHGIESKARKRPNRGLTGEEAEALEKCNGNIMRAARMLGIKYPTFQARVRRSKSTSGGTDAQGEP